MSNDDNITEDQPRLRVIEGGAEAEPKKEKKQASIVKYRPPPTVIKFPLKYTAPDGSIWWPEMKLNWDKTKWVPTPTCLNIRLVLIAAVRRARRPGTKFDQILTLEGPEGLNKSTAIKVLAGEENFSDTTILGMSDKQQMENVRGVWLYEIADLSGIKRAEVEAVKAFASRTSDKARPAYGRCVVDQPRRCVFFATTNERTYLKSQTGNCRFWPVQVGNIDIESLQRDRDHLWAEAAYYEKQGAS